MTFTVRHPHQEKWGYPPVRKDGKDGIPPIQLGKIGVPPSPRWGVNWQNENSTFPHPSDAGGNQRRITVLQTEFVISKQFLIYWNFDSVKLNWIFYVCSGPILLNKYGFFSIIFESWMNGPVELLHITDFGSQKIASGLANYSYKAPFTLYD